MNKSGVQGTKFGYLFAIMLYQTKDYASCHSVGLCVTMTTWYRKINIFCYIYFLKGGAYFFQRGGGQKLLLQATVQSRKSSENCNLNSFKVSCTFHFDYLFTKHIKVLYVFSYPFQLICYVLMTLVQVKYPLEIVSAILPLDVP